MTGSRTVFLRLALLLALATSLVSIAAAQSFRFPTSGRFILPPSLGKKLLDQCSRPVPTMIIEFWQPSEKEIDVLEVSLAKYLEQREKDGKSIPPKGLYHRQYVGFVSQVGSVHNSERFIYGNFYPDAKEILSDWRDGRPRDEAKGPMDICDGGPAFWGIVYQVSTKTFEAPEFNGGF